MAATSDETNQNGAIHFKCVCGGELQIEPELLGRVFSCTHCGRYLRAGLQFLMADEEIAPNLTGICTCGRFMVERVARVGKVAKCPVCGQRMTLPKAVDRPGADRVVRVQPGMLVKQLARLRGKRRQRRQPQRIDEIAIEGRVSLRPGQQVCANSQCGCPLPLGANVCARCGVNVKTGVAYLGPGPERDPKAKWKRTVGKNR